MTDELKSCPFCGANSTILYRDNSMSKWRWSVDCDGTTCGASGPIEATEADAVKAWNTRADGWQDIATAPRDGTLVQLYCARAELPVSVGYYENTAGIPWESADRWVMFEMDGMVSAFMPTHWRPLPAAPQVSV